MSRLIIGLTIAIQMLSGSAELPLIDDFAVRSEVLPSISYNVLRMDLDVTGDAVPELLLAHSRSQGTSGIQEWFVYSKTGERTYRLLDILGFSYLTFRIAGQGDSQRFLAYYRGQDHGSGAIVTYKVDGTGFSEESRAEQVTAGGDEWSAFEAWRRTIGLKVITADLDRIRQNQAAWKDLLTDESVEPPISLTEVTVPR